MRITGNLTIYYDIVYDTVFRHKTSYASGLGVYVHCANLGRSGYHPLLKVKIMRDWFREYV